MSIGIVYLATLAVILSLLAGFYWLLKINCMSVGPALNPLIKAMNLAAILIAPIVINPQIASVTRVVIVMVVMEALTVAVIFSKRGSSANDTAVIVEVTVRLNEVYRANETLALFGVAAV